MFTSVLELVLTVLLSIAALLLFLGGFLALLSFAFDLAQKVRIEYLKVDRQRLDFELYEEVSRAKVARYCRETLRD